MAPVKVDDLIKNRINLREHRLPPGNPPIILTFGSAVQFMKNWINELRDKHDDQILPLVAHFPLNDAHADIYDALESQEIPHHDWLSTPPQNEFQRMPAHPSELRFLVGAILHMLYEERFIKDYGKTDKFWIRVY